MKFPKNLSTVEVKEGGDGEYGPMPVGDYTCIVDTAEEKTSANGNEMIKLVLKLKGNEKYDGKLLFHYIVNSGDGSIFLEQMVKMLASMNQSTDIDSLDADDLVGLACKVHTKHEEYNGEQQDKVHYFVSIDPIQQAQLMAQSGTVRPLKDVENDMDLPF